MQVRFPRDSLTNDSQSGNNRYPTSCSRADFITSTLRFLHRRVLKPSCPIIKRAAASKLKECLSEGSAVPPSGSGIRPNHLPHIPNEVRGSRQQEEQGGNKGRDKSGHSWVGTGLCDTCKSKAKGLTPLPRTPHYRLPRPLPPPPHRCDPQPLQTALLESPTRTGQHPHREGNGQETQKGCHNRKETSASLREAPVSPTPISAPVCLTLLHFTTDSF